MDLAKRIRQHSHEKITEHWKRMKISHDRWIKVNSFQVGDVVGLIIPAEYKNKNANKLPVVVIEIRKSKVENQMTVNIEDKTEEDENLNEEYEEDGYVVAYGDNRLDGVYYQHEMIKIHGKQDYYGAIVRAQEHKLPKNSWDGPRSTKILGPLETSWTYLERRIRPPVSKETKRRQ
jgi:hypothetical protein